jgi:hypothetical protein
MQVARAFTSLVNVPRGTTRWFGEDDLLVSASELNQIVAVESLSDVDNDRHGVLVRVHQDGHLRGGFDGDVVVAREKPEELLPLLRTEQESVRVLPNVDDRLPTERHWLLLEQDPADLFGFLGPEKVDVDLVYELEGELGSLAHIYENIQAVSGHFSLLFSCLDEIANTRG